MGEMPSRAQDDTLTQTTVNPYLRTVRICAAGSILIGVSGILGWIFGIPELNSIIPGLKPFAISASLVFLALGIVQFLSASAPCRHGRMLIFLGVTGIITLFGLLEIIQLITGVLVSIEDAILRHYPALFNNPNAHIAPIAMVLVLLIGLGQTLYLSQCVGWTPRRGVSHLVGIIGALVMIGALVSLLGYLYGTPFLLGRENLPISALAALAALLLGVGLVVLAGDEAFPLSQFTGASTQARLLRAFLPLTAMLMLVLSLA